MKRASAMILCLAVLLALAAGCADKGVENITFTAVIEGVGDNSILVTTTDDVGFDKASVRFTDELQLDFELMSGQTVKITILPQIAESYPVQVSAVAIELVKQADSAS